MKLQTLLSIIVILSISSHSVMAQNSPRQDVEGFYEPMTYNKIKNPVAPRINQKNLRQNADGSSSLFFSGQGCPNEISIGSVDTDTPIFGGIDIEVVINNDITIVCQ